MDKDLLEVERIHFNELRDSSNDKSLDDLDRDFIVNYTFDSVTIDGKNTLSYHLTKELIESEIIKTNISEREQKEVLNHKRAYEYIKRLTMQRIRLTEEVLKDIHEILVDGIFVGGRYRNVNVQLLNSIHQPPDYIKVYDRMRKYFYDIDNFSGNTIQKAAFAHAGISKIHPFLEGNGRIARLVLNYYLMYDGYLPISLSKSEKDEYHKLLDIFKEEKNLSPFSEFIYHKLLNNYEQAIEALEK